MTSYWSWIGSSVSVLCTFTDNTIGCLFHTRGLLFGCFTWTAPCVNWWSSGSHLPISDERATSCVIPQYHCTSDGSLLATTSATPQHHYTSAPIWHIGQSPEFVMCLFARITCHGIQPLKTRHPFFFILLRIENFHNRRHIEIEPVPPAARMLFPNLWLHWQW